MPLFAAVSALLPGISSFSAFLHRHWRLRWWPALHQMTTNSWHLSKRKKSNISRHQASVSSSTLFSLLCSLFMPSSCMPLSLVLPFLSRRNMGGGRVCTLSIPASKFVPALDSSTTRLILPFWSRIPVVHLSLYLTFLSYLENFFFPFVVYVVLGGLVLSLDGSFFRLGFVSQSCNIRFFCFAFLTFSFSS